MKHKIPFYLIESFIVSCDFPTFQEAAQELGITQSTLSKQMIMLEELLPHKAFTFDGRKKVLTKYGETLYETLKPKFSQTQEIIEQVALHFDVSEHVDIRICGRGELLDLLASRLKFKGRITFMPMSNEEAIESVRMRIAEIALVHSSLDSHELMMKPFLTNSFKFTVSRKLCKKIPKPEDLIELAKQKPCLMYKMNDPVFEGLLKTWKISVEELKIFRVYPNYTTLSKMAERGLGWAILPSHTNIDEKTCHVIPVTSKTLQDRQFYLLYRKEFSSVPWMKEILAEASK